MIKVLRLRVIFAALGLVLGLLALADLASQITTATDSEAPLSARTGGVRNVFLLLSPSYAHREAQASATAVLAGPPATNRRDLEPWVTELLSLSPTNSALWLSLAKLSQAGPPAEAKRAADALVMSYLTAPNDLELIPLRLKIVSTMNTPPDPLLEDLVRGDIRTILLGKVDLRSQLADAYRIATPSSKAFILQTAKDMDPRFAATLAPVR